MSEEIDIVIREALPSDAAEVIRFLEKTAVETDFLSMGSEGVQLTLEEEELHLERIVEAENVCLLVALLGKKVIAAASLTGNQEPKLCHIAELGVSVERDYWGFGLGTNLVTELIEWAIETERVRRIELTVQARNQRAIDLYRKVGFVEEGVMQRGVFSDGVYLDV